MKALILKTDNENGKVIEFEKDKLLEMLYKEIECDTVEVVRKAKVSGVTFDIWVNENGLFKEDPIMMAENLTYPSQKLFGNIVLIPSELDENGDILRGFTPEEILKISYGIKKIIDMERGRVRPLLIYEM